MRVHDFTVNMKKEGVLGEPFTDAESSDRPSQSAVELRSVTHVAYGYFCHELVPFVCSSRPAHAQADIQCLSPLL